MTILLVRHGETQDNARHIFQNPDSALSDRGHFQAEKLAARLNQRTISDIICSDYLRTKQTADHTAKLTGLKPRFTELLRERNFGDLRGRAYADLNFDPFAVDYQPINGEGWSSFNERVERAWALITSVVETATADVLVVTHGFVCRSIILNHAQLSGDLKIPDRWGNTSLSEIGHQAPWPIYRLNCTSHLNLNSLPSAQA